MRSLSRSGTLYDFMHFISDFSTTKWIIFAAIIILGFAKGWRAMSVPVGLSIVAALLGDLVSRRLVKAFIMRPRPGFLNEACDVSACWGFISSHAANVFAVTAVLYLFSRRTLWWTLPIATLVSFSRVYLIDHYPLDVIGGALIGTLIGFIVWTIYQRIKDKITRRKILTSKSGEPQFMKHSILVSIFAGVFCIFSIFYSDEAVAQTLADPSLLWFRQFCREITNIGLSVFYFGLAAFSYAMARWVFPGRAWFSIKPKLVEQIRSASAFSLLALFFAGIIVQVLKIAFGRQRPHVSETFNGFHFDPVNFHWHWHSFPSGHAQVVFVVGTLLSLAWPKYKVWFLIGALAIAFTRVATHQHFLSDIILGGAIGYLATIWLYRNRQKKNSPLEQPN